MPNVYDAVNVKCPYYRKYESNRICCEGLKEGTGINMTFENCNKRKQYMVNYCNSIGNYKKCMICYTLDRKYGVKDGE
jgi:hypothetical protein